MKLFLDTGNIKDIETYCAIGIIDGVTTNPSLMAKESGDPREITKRICQIVQGPVSAEVIATDVDGMIREGRDLATIDPHVVIKVPFGKAGVQACKTLRAEGIRVNVTLVFSAAQALLAAKVGRHLRQPVRRPPRRHRHRRHGAHPADRRDLPQLRVRDRGARGQHPPPDARRGGGPDGRRHLHVPAGGHRGACSSTR